MSGAHEIGLSVSFGNKRYWDAWKGLDALADTLGRNVDDLGHVVAREMRTFINAEMAKLAKRHSGRATTPTKLATRTGKLMRELRRGGVVTGGPRIKDVEGRITIDAPGARINEYGGTIRPREGNYVFVPLPAALKSDGTPKKLNPRQWSDTFIAESRNGNLLLFRRLGRKLEPLYALKPQVKIRPRLGLVKQMKRGFPEFADRMLEAMFDTLTKDIN